MCRARRSPVRIGGNRAVSASLFDTGGWCVSIVRIGLAESKDFAEGYDAIFGKKKAGAKKAKAKTSKPKASAKKPKKKKK
jgi:hypothetical protein